MQAWQATVQDEQGNVVFNPSVTVYLEDGVTLAPIFNEDGSPKGNPFTGSLEGFVQFWANPGVYKIVGANGSDSTEVWEASLTDYDRYGSYADFINSYIPSRVDTASALVGGVLVSWRRDPAGTIGPTADGGMWSPADGWISPLHWGALGDAATDDTVKLNLMFDYIRTLGVSGAEINPIIVDGGPCIYRCDGSINATGIKPRDGLTISNLHIWSHGFDITVLDLTGSRRYYLENIIIRGGNQFNANTNPWCGILLARGELADDPSKFVNMNNVHVDGYFRGAALQCYATEEIQATSCYFWNRRVADGSTVITDPTYAPSYAAIFDGRARLPIKSQFQTTLVDVQDSYTVNNWTSCKFQKPFGILGPTVYISDMNSARFTKPYITNGGGSAIEWHLIGPAHRYDVVFEGLQVETFGNSRIFEFIPHDAATTYDVRGLRVTMANVFSDQEFMLFNDDPDGTGALGSNLQLRGATIKIPRWGNGIPVNGVFNPKSKFSLTGVDLTVPYAADYTPITEFGGFHGRTFHTEENTSFYRGAFRAANEVVTPKLTITSGWQSFTPTLFVGGADITAGGGTYGTRNAEYKIVDDLAYVRILLSLTALGTNTGNASIPLPAAITPFADDHALGVADYAGMALLESNVGARTDVTVGIDLFRLSQSTGANTTFVTHSNLTNTTRIELSGWFRIVT